MPVPGLSPGFPLALAPKVSLTPGDSPVPGIFQATGTDDKHSAFSPSEH